MSFQNKARELQRRAGGEEAPKPWSRAGSESSLGNPGIGKQKEGSHQGHPKAEGTLEIKPIMRLLYSKLPDGREAGTDITQVSYANVTSIENLPGYQDTLPASSLFTPHLFVLTVCLPDWECYGAGVLMSAAESLAPNRCWAR